MEQHILEAYAQVILRVGINLQKGQNLMIVTEPVHWPFVNIVAAEAYKIGAHYVQTDIVDPGLLKARIEHADAATLDYFPETINSQYHVVVNEKWSIIYIDGDEDPGFFDNADPERSAMIEKSRRKARMFFSQAMVNGICPWVIAPVATEKWAAKILGMPPSAEAREQLWHLLSGILLLEEADPVASWWQISDGLNQRARMLNAKQLSYVRFAGPGTDLKVYLTPHSQWVGGAHPGQNGFKYLANLPTFEIFATPDYRRTEGTVRVTRPVKVLGSNVEEGWFKFAHGKVVEYGAKKGRELLDKFFAMEAQAAYLGEVALVDSSSPIFKTGKLYDSILLDENAACHIALGRGLTVGLKDGHSYSQEALDAMGCNVAMQHTDFMIGSGEISVYGDLADGREEPIIEAGHFKI